MNGTELLIQGLLVTTGECKDQTVFPCKNLENCTYSFDKWTNFTTLSQTILTADLNYQKYDQLVETF
jgi:hypothetical protein